jgi:hypothetical protein
MNWEKLGMIFDLSTQKLQMGIGQFAQSPQALVFPEFVRIYFSTREWDAVSSKFTSIIAFADYDKEFKQVLKISNQAVIKAGALGSFDEHGIFPINVLRYEDKIMAYTCGWSRRVSVAVETSTGLAYSTDNGETFERFGKGPVLTSSLKEPFLVGDSFVKVYDHLFHMWYIYGERWMVSTNTEPPARVYKIAHATSPDGIEWHKEEGKQIISDVLGPDECQALPTVLKIGGRYHMYFCYRYATDFRKNHERAYRLGYAWSDDLTNWKRDDEQAGISKSTVGWDSEMMCYPNLFECDGSVYLLYNGNEFGKHGFGLAKLLNEDVNVKHGN